MRSRALVHRRGLFGQGMHAAVDVAVRGVVISVHRLDHRVGFLRGRGRVEIHQPYTRVDFPLHNGEIAAHLAKIGY
jgi:hypothetical protein